MTNIKLPDLPEYWYWDIQYHENTRKGHLYLVRAYHIAIKDKYASQLVEIFENRPEDVDNAFNAAYENLAMEAKVIEHKGTALARVDEHLQAVRAQS